MTPLLTKGPTRRHTRRIVVHASDTFAHQDIGVKEIDAWHKQRGWAGVGYHLVIRRDGTVEEGRALDLVGAHVQGANQDTIAICLVGGKGPKGEPQQNYTEAQYDALVTEINNLLALYPEIPKADPVRGHRDYPGVRKSCPCMDVRAWWKSTFKPDR